MLNSIRYLKYDNFKLQCDTRKKKKMKFGKIFRIKISSIMPEWEGECISYKDLKKQLNLMDPAERDEGFQQLLKDELEKMNDFFVRTQEEYTNRFQELKDMVADEYSSEDTTLITRDLLQFHNKLVLLLHYNVLNCDGFLKIIKKHRKKTGRSFSLSFMHGDNQQLFFIANSLGELLAECREILEELLRPTMMKAVCLVVLFAFISISSQARSIIQKPQPNPNFKINSTNHQNARTCSFIVEITTSCSSVRYTRDQISISFGDAYGNQVYAPRIDDPSTRTFERCSGDTFEIYGPCTYQICYLYLYRSGYDGWKPERVDVYGYNTRAVSFYYNVWIPANIWYGFDYCSPYRSATK
ncbi:hypothetical protein L2E82_16325 [Cichorium intybus]|uniref:Uncharacterized protein n=1 Tax=Cichorium intybus TaxID=13427 RepID=A0ACB9F6J1_CICIN|nr:hypothetical protein L2E82_16325 [Cichorium intybus]